MSMSKVKIGARYRAVFYLNTRSDSPFRLRATHLDGVRAPKVVLCDAAEVEPGVLWEVEVTGVTKPKSKDRGYVEVRPVRPVAFHLDDDIYVPEMLSRKLEALIEAGLNILLDGPQGSGKTVLTRSLAKACRMEYVFFNCSAIFEATDFLATVQVRATEKGGVETSWIKTDILRAFEDARAHPEKRFLIFLDEFNRCREMARNGIMPALDSTRRMFNPITGTTEFIPPNILWVAAINNGAQFTGTTTVDPAQLDRFAPLKITYPPRDEEVAILRRRYPDVSKKLVATIVEAAGAVRANADLGLGLSMRATEEACLLMSHPNFLGRDDLLPEVLKDTFCARVQGRWDDEMTDAGMMWKVVKAAI